jgi:DNA polymerase-3 subunit epsilon|tara:strand:- start:892 stop:1203 length:312 start_codon:yes stop_codon:yes gene_type:complete
LLAPVRCVSAINNKHGIIRTFRKIIRVSLTALAADVAGVFCSQRAAQPWAQSVGIACSERGPSLDALTKHLRIKSLRQANNNYHGALIDAQQTANVVRHLQAL